MAKGELLEERLTESIIGAFYDVYNRLGYGFFESAYIKALMIELGYRGLEAQREVKVDLYYRGFHLGRQRVDLIVDEKVIVEVKACDEMPKVALRQCLSYLRTTGLRVGLVVNFGAEPRIKRVVCSGASLGPNTEVVFPVEAGPAPGASRMRATQESRRADALARNVNAEKSEKDLVRSDLVSAQCTLPSTRRDRTLSDLHRTFPRWSSDRSTLAHPREVERTECSTRKSPMRT